MTKEDVERFREQLTQEFGSHIRLSVTVGQEFGHPRGKSEAERIAKRAEALLPGAERGTWTSETPSFGRILHGITLGSVTDREVTVIWSEPAEDDETAPAVNQ